MHTVLDSLNYWLKQAMADDERVILLGEDIVDPYGGAFKVTRSLTVSYPDRVITTPISEAGILGVATGMALRGFTPVVEIMFGDFSTLIVDQVINQLSKLRSMYNSIERLPVIVRTPMGGRRGYGPTHSQSLERLFFGVPNLNVIAPCHYLGGAGELLYKSIMDCRDPVLFAENKLQYLLRIVGTDEKDEIKVTAFDPGSAVLPTYLVGVRGAPAAAATIITYGYMAAVAQQAMVELALREEVFVDMLVVTQLSPYSINANALNYIGSNDILILEEGIAEWGWGSEIAARLIEGQNHTNRKIVRLGAQNQVIPASPVLEEKVLPQVSDIKNMIRHLRGME